MKTERAEESRADGLQG